MSVLLIDRYQLTMLQAYREEGLTGRACFELSVRRLPPQRRFLVAAGLETALQWLETLAVEPEELDWVARQPGLGPRVADALAGLRFEGDVDALPEGTVCFAEEPLLRVSAPLPVAQLVESRLLNLVHLQTVVASKAARLVLAADGRPLVDFGLRRAHGGEAALLAARAAWLSGFEATATVEAGRRWGLPLAGTMAHSYVQAHRSEVEAFDAFLRVYPHDAVLLVDTYDTDAAVAAVVARAPAWRAEGALPVALRIDSGDLAAQARQARARLDAAGLEQLGLLASGDLDEHRIAALRAAGAPIDRYGVGTALTASTDAPVLDAVYKLQAYEGRPCRKRSAGKATWPGPRQVCRWHDAHGRLLRDRVQRADEPLEGRPLLQPVMRDGRRTGPAPTLAAIRAHAASERAALPPELCRLVSAAPGEAGYPVVISEGLRALADALDAKAGDGANGGAATAAGPDGMTTATSAIPAAPAGSTHPQPHHP